MRAKATHVDELDAYNEEDSDDEESDDGNDGEDEDRYEDDVSLASDDARDMSFTHDYASCNKNNLSFEVSGGLSERMYRRRAGRSPAVGHRSAVLRPRSVTVTNFEIWRSSVGHWRKQVDRDRPLTDRLRGLPPVKTRV